MTMTKESAPKNTPRFRRKLAPERRDQLIDAAVRCLGNGGMAAFTIDRICQEAGVSRGLINHHFGNKEGLLEAVYDSMTTFLAENESGQNDVPPAERLNALIAMSFKPGIFSKTQLRAWLALWEALSSSPRLKSVHRARYRTYRDGLAAAISQIAGERGREVNARRLAQMLIALIDGLWLEWCLDDKLMSRKEAIAACYDLIEPYTGPIDR